MIPGWPAVVLAFAVLASQLVVARPTRPTALDRDTTVSTLCCAASHASRSVKRAVDGSRPDARRLLPQLDAVPCTAFALAPPARTAIALEPSPPAPWRDLPDVETPRARGPPHA